MKRPLIGFGINPPIGNVAGAFVSIAVVVLVSRVIQVSDTLFYSGLVFVFMASPMGSVINLYRSFGPYDKIIHFISGMLLAGFGMMMISRLLKRAFPDEEGLSTSPWSLRPACFPAAEPVYGRYLSSWLTE